MSADAALPPAPLAVPPAPLAAVRAIPQQRTDSPLHSDPVAAQQAPTALSVIVPSRNERDNIAPLLLRLHAAMGGVQVEVIFVDDSEDDTPEVIQACALTYEHTETRVAVIHRVREERTGGLSGAVLKGFAAAASPWVAVMDSDLQHPPEVMPKLLQRAEVGDVDLVVGSRYVDDGQASGLSGLTRRLISLSSGGAAHLFFPRRLKDVTDPMSGLFLVRRDLLALETYKPLGFKILLEVAVRHAPLKVGEVPYEFAPRNAGESKASVREGLQFVRHLLRLKATAPGPFERMLGVGLVGLTGIAVNTAALWFFAAYVGLGLTVAAVLATQFSTTWNFLLADRFVYRSHRFTGSWIRRLLAFALVNNTVLLLRLPILHLLVGYAHLDYRVANIVTLLVAFGARFIVVDRSIYRGVKP